MYFEWDGTHYCMDYILALWGEILQRSVQKDWPLAWQYVIYNRNQLILCNKVTEKTLPTHQFAPKTCFICGEAYSEETAITLTCSHTYLLYKLFILTIE
jgi:hypothetical protein